MRYFFLILFFVAPLILQGQEIKVNVFYKNEPLPYTYISVNGTPIAIANAAGVANIPVDKLNSGDTITSKMIGLLPAFLIYDQQIQQNRECELIHTEEDIFALGEVVVTFYDNNSSRRIFRRNVNTYHQLLQNCLVNAKFTYKITLSDGTTYPIEGVFVLENNLPRIADYSTSYFNTTLPQIETKSDTTNLSRELLRDIRYIYRVACATIGQLHIEHRGQQPYSNMSYLGLRDGLHFFRYSNSDPIMSTVLQILFEAEEDSKELTNAKLTTLNVRDDGFSSDFTINISCEKLGNVPPRGRTTITVPEDIEANIIRPNGNVIYLKISDISIQFK